MNFICILMAVALLTAGLPGVAHLRLAVALAEDEEERGGGRSGG